LFYLQSDSDLEISDPGSITLRKEADPDPHFLILPHSDDTESEEPEQEVDDENQELEAAVAA
jgi:hypothetical protein